MIAVEMKRGVMCFYSCGGGEAKAEVSVRKKIQIMSSSWVCSRDKEDLDSFEI